MAVLTKRCPEVMKWSARDAVRSDEAAALMVLGLLGDDWRLRAAFPTALTDGIQGGYGRLLRSSLLPAEVMRRVESVFAVTAEEPVLNLYLHDCKLQEKMPDALLPAGRAAFVKWLCGTGLKRGAITPWQILWYARCAEEQVADGLELTYLIQPSWQERHPDIATEEGWENLVKDKQALLGGDGGVFGHTSQAVKKEVQEPGVNVVAHFCFDSGLQQAGLHTVSALRQAGVPVSLRDVPVTAKTRMLGRRSCLGLERHGVSMVHFTPNPFYHEAYKRAGLHPRAGVHRIGLCSWELPHIPQEWLPEKPLFDEVWAFTRIIGQSVSAYGVPVAHVLPGLRLPAFTPTTRAQHGLPEEKFLFMFMYDACSVMERKNPLGLVKAFRLAFAAPEPVALAIKVSHAEADPASQELLRGACRTHGVHLLEETLEHPETCALMNCCDSYVSLHRSEGFGLTMAEAMLMGKPVVATGYSGNLDFMNGGNSRLVKWTPTVIEQDYPNYPKGGQWAEPDLEDAARHLRWVYDQRDTARQLGQTARREMESLLSMEAASARMMERLGPLLQSQRQRQQ